LYLNFSILGYMRRFVLLSLLMIGSLAAQAFTLNRLPPGLVGYLELTDAQQQQIVQANLGFQVFSLQKQRRSAQVQLEIAAETAKPDLDPMALGLRYRELEAIRREMSAEQARAVQTVQGILTTAQRQKLSVLQEALRMQSTACDAVNWNLMTYPVVEPQWVDQPNVISRILIPQSIMGGGCGSITGNFTSLPRQP